MRRNLSTKPQQKAKVPRLPSPFVTNPLPPVHVSGAINFMTLFKMNGEECATTYELFSRCREPSTNIITLLTIRKVDVAVVVYSWNHQRAAHEHETRGEIHTHWPLYEVHFTLYLIASILYGVPDQHGRKGETTLMYEQNNP